MKANKKSSTSKLVSSFDNQLKRIIMTDLKAIKARNQFLRIAS
ncbi:hypothetical protein [Mucilaginibacter pocheonensis]|uniref:Transposase n=1 Tax=Mucilaginibacter pocheonensis TaxID=398050 RepID=A0ABU1TJ07_9SPHI|nr:hypothetical protein [Mucilaginibacter pocheonensis]MDR6945381.1 hypothetical protein [Mucilaginibacter pocheonensis]